MLIVGESFFNFPPPKLSLRFVYSALNIWFWKNHIDIELWSADLSLGC